MFFDVVSVYRGMRHMSALNNARWSVKWMPKRFWLHAWTPVWHNNNGPYLSCGVYVIAIYRGY